MPNYFKGRHSGFLTRHYETGIKRIINKETMTYAIHSEGYTIPVLIIIKMLPCKGSNVQYAAFIRERIIDYDFVLTNPQGKIEMISKNLVNTLKLNISLINSVDCYYLHYICKEYLDEISNINLQDYSITDFSKKDDKQSFKYFLLHFKFDPQVDISLKEFKKNENSTNTTTKNTPLIKIKAKKELIKHGYKNGNSSIYYSTLELTEVCLGENLHLIKLYSNISNDLNVNLDEINQIDCLINKTNNYQLAINKQKDESSNKSFETNSVNKLSDSSNSSFSSGSNKTINSDRKKIQLGSDEDSSEKDSENSFYNKSNNKILIPKSKATGQFVQMANKKE